MADIAKVKRNIQKMIDLGAPEADIDVYVSEEGLTAEALRAAPKPVALTPEAAAAAEGRNLPSPAGYAPQKEPTPSSPGRAFQLGSQAVGRGLADIVGMPGDLSTGIANLGLAGADLAARPFGGGVDFRFSPSPIGSERLSDTAGSIMSAAGVPPVEPESNREKLLYNAERFGTQALTLGGALARTGAAVAPSATPRTIDPFIQPYAQNPLKTVAGDTAAGAGSGAMLTASQGLPSEFRDAGGGAAGTIADYLAMLAGGVGGAMGYGAAVEGPAAVRSFLTAKKPSQLDVDPATGQPFSNRAADVAAEKLQARASDPRAAADNIDTMTSELFGLPLPTTGLMSGDTGLIGLEQAQRTRQGSNSLAGAAEVDPGEERGIVFPQ